MGRHSSYTQDVADAICERLANGESARSICRDDAMPYMSVMFRWLTQNEEFRKQYTLAREVQAETFADEMLSIADNTENDVQRDVQRDRLRLDTRKWLASKILPKKYGDKVMNEHSGPDGSEIPVAIKVIFGAA